MLDEVLDRDKRQQNLKSAQICQISYIAKSSTYFHLLLFEQILQDSASPFGLQSYAIFIDLPVISQVYYEFRWLLSVLLL